MHYLKEYRMQSSGPGLVSGADAVAAGVRAAEESFPPGRIMIPWAPPKYLS